MPNVSSLVKTIQDLMRKDAGTYGDAQRMEQMAWMFFLKIFDDHEKELAETQDNYRSPLRKDLRWSTWAADEEGITGGDLLDFVNDTLLPTLQELKGGNDKISGLIRMAFEDANNYMKNGTLLRQVVNKINGIDFNASDDRHTFGDIYEKLLKDLQSAGNAGEFYTPRAVTQFIVDQVNPRLGELVMDPACGTGGFLTCVIDHLHKQAKSPKQRETIQDSFSGIEKKHLPHILCMTNLLLHGIKVPSNVRHGNTLARPLRDWGPKERVNVSNASSDYVRFYAPAQLDQLPLDDIFALNWVHADDQIATYRHRSRKCAEVLIPTAVPPSSIVGALVVDAATETALRGLGFALPITVDPTFFFR
jgi:type I restriction enzyme M protein